MLASNSFYGHNTQKTMGLRGSCEAPKSVFTLHIYEQGHERTVEIRERNLANIKVAHHPYGGTVVASPTEMVGIPLTATWTLQPTTPPQKPVIDTIADGSDVADLEVLVQLLREGLNADKVFSRPGAAKDLMKRFQKLLADRKSTSS